MSIGRGEPGEDNSRVCFGRPYVQIRFPIRSVSTASIPASWSCLEPRESTKVKPIMPWRSSFASCPFFPGLDMFSAGNRDPVIRSKIYKNARAVTTYAWPVLTPYSKDYNLTLKHADNSIGEAKLTRLCDATLDSACPRFSSIYVRPCGCIR